MIIGKSITALGGGGLKPEITVTAKAGALLNLHFKDSSIILQSYQLGASETTHTFVVNVSENVYVVEDVTNGKNEEVLIDTVAQYIVNLPYYKWLYKDGNEYTAVTGGWSTPTVAHELGYLDTTFDSCSITKQKLGSGLQLAGHRTTVGGGVSHFFASFYTTNRINVSGYSTLKLNLKCTCDQNYFNLTSSVYDKVPVGAVHGGWVKANQLNLPSGTNIGQTLTLDVSNLDSSYYVSIIFSEFSSSFANFGNGSVLVNSIWLE